MTTFITTQELTDYVGSDANTDQGQFACDAACQTVIDFLDNGLIIEEDVTVKLDGNGTDALVLPRPPVRSVTTVIESGVELTEDDDFYLAAAGILYRSDGTYPGSCMWPIGRGNVHVTYDRGYDLAPLYPGDLELPADIKLVALALAKRILASGALPVGGYQSETMGQYSYTLDSAAAASGVFALQDGEKAILSRYADHPVR